MYIAGRFSKLKQQISYYGWAVIWTSIYKAKTKMVGDKFWYFSSKYSFTIPPTRDNWCETTLHEVSTLACPAETFFINAEKTYV